MLPATNRNEGETNLVDPSPEAGMTPQLTMSRFVLLAIALHYSIIYDLQSFSVTNHLGHDSDGLSNCAGIRYIVSYAVCTLETIEADVTPRLCNSTIFDSLWLQFVMIQEKWNIAQWVKSLEIRDSEYKYRYTLINTRFRYTTSKL